MTIPSHVALIPDGNRRWAREKGLKVYDGHYHGFKIAREVVNHAADKGVEYMSLWGMSADNLIKRSPLEIKGLFKIFEEMFRDIIDGKDIHDRQVRVQVFGLWQQKFPRRLKNVIQEAIDATQLYGNHVLNFFLAYNGTYEMLNAIQAIADAKVKRVTPEILKQHLYTKDLPPVDLVIRTGGEPHLSAGFMMWDVADAELYFPEVYWPDFTPKEFDKALDFYASRERRFGK